MKRTRQFSALLLVLALALAWLPAAPLQPAPLEAAPARQNAAPALVGQYRSAVLPAASSPGLLVTLRLYDDGSAEVVSDYLNDEAPIIEVGDWTTNADGSVTLTVVGTEEMDYAQPVSLTFLVDESGALVVPGAPGGPFGEAGLRLDPLAAPPDFSALPADTLLFQSAVLPSAAGPGFQVTLALLSDGTLLMVSDYLEDGEFVVEVGTWEVAADGTLIVTLTGQSDRPYDQPVPLEFVQDDTGTLILVDEDGMLFGSEGLRLAPLTAPALPAAAAPAAEPAATPVPAEEATDATEDEAAAEDAAGAETAGDADAPATAEVDLGEGTVYSSLVLPTDDTGGVFVVAILYESGDALFSTYYLNGSLPVVEFARWEAGDDGALTISFLGTPETDYSSPIVVDALLDADGLLYLDEVPLYPLSTLGGAIATTGDEPTDEAGDETAEAPALLARFVSDERPAASAPGLLITLNLYADLSAEMISDYGDDQVVTESGEWTANEDGTLTVTLNGQTDRAYDEPLVLIFSVGDDDSLTLINDEDGALFGESGLVLSAVDLDTAESGLENWAELPGVVAYRSAVLPAASSPGLRLTLGLLEDGRAVLEYDYLNPGEVVTNFGTWEENADGTLTVTLDEGPSGPFAEPDVLTLEAGDDGSLTIVDTSETVVGLLDVILSPVNLDE